MSMLEVAVRYARRGWRCLPCHWINQGRCSCGDAECKSPGKHPLLRAWQRQATTDRSLISRWWGRSPDANVGVATGPASGLLVLDVDGSEGEHSLVDLERRHGSLPEMYPQSWTGGGRGGWQAFLTWPEGRQVGNSAGRLGPKLDTRGNGGYVVVPPSVTTEAYRWAPDRSPWCIPPEPCPGWLVDLLDPAPAPEPARQPWTPGRTHHVSDRYLARALEAELTLIAHAPNGRRNDALNDGAFRLFRFAQEGVLGAGAIADGLIVAARHAGLPEREIVATLRSAASKRGVRLP